MFVFETVIILVIFVNILNWMSHLLINVQSNDNIIFNNFNHSTVKILEPDVMTHTCHPSTWKAETEKTVRLRLAWAPSPKFVSEVQTPGWGDDSTFKVITTKA